MGGMGAQSNCTLGSLHRKEREFPTRRESVAVRTLEKQARLPLAFDFLGVKSVRIEATSSAKLRAIEPP